MGDEETPMNWDTLRDAINDPELMMASILAIVLFLDMVIPNAEQAITEMVTAISTAMKDDNASNDQSPTE